MSDASAANAPGAEDPQSLDEALHDVLDRFDASHRLDRSHDQLRCALRSQLLGRGYAEAQLRLLEVNLFGSLSGWMEFILDERVVGRDAVPDFARHLRRAFLTHCRDHAIEPSDALQMVVKLANIFMDLAVSYRKRLSLGESEPAYDEVTP